MKPFYAKFESVLSRPVGAGDLLVVEFAVEPGPALVLHALVTCSQGV